MALVGMEADHELSQPIAANVRTQRHDPAHRGVAVLERVGERAGEVGDGRVKGHAGRHLAAIDQHFGAWADAGDEGLHQDLSRVWSRQWLLPQIHAAGRDEAQRLSRAWHR